MDETSALTVRLINKNNPIYNIVINTAVAINQLFLIAYLFIYHLIYAKQQSMSVYIDY